MRDQKATESEEECVFSSRWAASTAGDDRLHPVTSVIPPAAQPEKGQ